MFKFSSFTVSPKLPENLSFLQTLAKNVWWSWSPDASELFRRIDPRLFKSTYFNPIAMLSTVSQERLEKLSKDNSFISHMEEVKERFDDEVMTSRNWKSYDAPRKCIAYFSMEFGLHESIHIYSGGLGILAGDHLKSASDLDVPLCGIGILYREGYFEQEVDGYGHQIECYPENRIMDLPITRARDRSGQPVLISVPLPEGPLHVTAWRLDVGRVPLILLDTNVPENNPDLRWVTGRLYGGDKLNRLRQELVLGIGGLRVLDAMGFEVTASHMNEGHAAFLGVERITKAMKGGLSFEEACEFVRRTSVFTTHTPVPAGNETFKLDMLYPHLQAIERECDGRISAETIKQMGADPRNTAGDELSMTVLGLRCSRYCNGVAKLHGVVERDMWHHLWPDFPAEEVPIGHVTNGVHVPTWISTDNSRLFARVLGPDWDRRALSHEELEKIEHISAEDLWRVHESARAHLIRAARENLERGLRRRNAPLPELAAARSVLSKDSLTIGFARRFATYKRATLLLSDKRRLKKILTDPNRPVQFIFAGKAHPADGEGKDLIRQISEFAKEPELRGKIIFLENYNMHIARRLVRGVDVWLNTPRRPNEASGTSGMKACQNGAIHVSTLDGWWPEGYSKDCGWAIGNGEDFGTDYARQDYSDAQALYNLLETEIIPTFFDRPNGELPARWIDMMKKSIRMCLENFTSARMVTDYLQNSYTPAMASYETLRRDDFAKLRGELSARKSIEEHWGGISIEFPVTDRDIQNSSVGEAFTASCKVRLGGIAPEAVKVELFIGQIKAQGSIIDGDGIEMKRGKDLGKGVFEYSAKVSCNETGSFGYSARVLPRGEEWTGLMPGHITWAQPKE